MMMRALLGLVLWGIGVPAWCAAQPPLPPPIEREGVAVVGMTAERPWGLSMGDFNGDGNLDVAISEGLDTGPRTRIYRFIEETSNVEVDDRNPNQRIIVRRARFEPASFGNDLLQAWMGTVAWADYDGDGVNDLLVTGTQSLHPPYTPTLRLSRFRGGDLIPDTRAAATLPAVYNSAVAWGDYDGDGDPDLALAGRTADGLTAGIYRNDLAGDQATFVRAAALPAAEGGAFAWGDYDGDGDPDLAFTGNTAAEGPLSRLYRNDGGTFTDVGADLTGLATGAVSWGDYDRDGDLDLLLAGGVYGPALLEGITRVYRNDSGTFTSVPFDLPRLLSRDAQWGDYDGDGDLDILLAGSDALKGATRVYVYEQADGGFAEGTVFGSLTQGGALWFDYECDGDVDVLVIGETDGVPYLFLYRSGPTTDLRPLLLDPRVEQMACPAS